MLNQLYVILTGSSNYENVNVSVTDILKLVDYRFISEFHFSSNVLLLFLKGIYNVIIWQIDKEITLEFANIMLIRSHDGADSITYIKSCVLFFLYLNRIFNM